MPVPTFQVFCFNFIKKPIISALWYAVLVYTLMLDSTTIPLIIGFVILMLSFTQLRLYFAILSPVPCIVEIILAYNLARDYFIIFLVVGIIWMILYSVGMFVWHRIAKGIYVLDPVTNVLKYDSKYYITSGFRKR